jgi:hypothetical protein
MLSAIYLKFWIMNEVHKPIDREYNIVWIHRSHDKPFLTCHITDLKFLNDSSVLLDYDSSRRMTTFINMYDLRFSWWWLWRMVSPGMLHHVVLVRTDVSEELSASLLRVTRIGELGKMLAVTSIWRMLRRNIKFLRNVGSYKSHTA